MQDLNHPGPGQRQPQLVDTELAHAVSLSLKVCYFLFFVCLIWLYFGFV